jgi:hypothetical protein
MKNETQCYIFEKKRFFHYKRSLKFSFLSVFLSFCLFVSLSFFLFIVVIWCSLKNNGLPFSRTIYLTALVMYLVKRRKTCNLNSKMIVWGTVSIKDRKKNVFRNIKKKKKLFCFYLTLSYSAKTLNILILSEVM